MYITICYSNDSISPFILYNKVGEIRMTHTAVQHKRWKLKCYKFAMNEKADRTLFTLTHSNCKGEPLCYYTGVFVPLNSSLGNSLYVFCVCFKFWYTYRHCSPINSFGWFSKVAYLHVSDFEWRCNISLCS